MGVPGFGVVVEEDVEIGAGAEIGAEESPFSSTERFCFTIEISITMEVIMKIPASQ